MGPLDRSHCGGVGWAFNFGRSLAGSSSHGKRSSRRVCRSTRWPDDVGERRIVTAVAGSSNKVGGKTTLIVVLRPLERSAQLRAAIVHSGAVALAATKKNPESQDSSS